MPSHPLFRGIGYASHRETRVPLRPAPPKPPSPTEVGFGGGALVKGAFPDATNARLHVLFRQLWLQERNIKPPLKERHERP